jgi:hypothetical protein
LPYYLNSGTSELKQIKKIKYQKAQKTLKNLDISYPKYGKEYVFRIFDYLSQTGFFPKKTSDHNHGESIQVFLL